VNAPNSSFQVLITLQNFRSKQAKELLESNKTCEYIILKLRAFGKKAAVLNGLMFSRMIFD
jgi:hypothetical protein